MNMRDAKKSWRLIQDTSHDAATNMAVDEAMLYVSDLPTLRLYSWTPAAVSLGYFQSLDKEVDLERCRKNGIDVVRRITGGGAVFHEKELTYSFTCPESLVPADIIRSYELLCGIIADALKRSGVDAVFSPINDILAGRKKISGSAQTRKQGKVLQHGTIIFDVDVERMFSILRVPDEKLKDKMIRNAKERVTSLKEHGITDIAGLKRNIISAFEKRFRVRLEPLNLSKEENALADELKIKFQSREWNHLR